MSTARELMKHRLEEVVHRHRRFWDGCLEEPLIAELPHPDWSRKPYPISGDRWITEPRRLSPEDFDVSRILGEQSVLPPHFTGDFIHGIRTVFPVAFMESVIGCPVFAADTSCYSKPAVTDYQSARSFDAEALNQSWIEILDRVVDRENAIAGDEYPSIQLHLRGVVDMLAAYLGEALLCTALYDDPGLVASLGGEFTKAYLSIANRGLRRRNAWNGGYVSPWGVYAPGPLLDYQIDASSIISPETYERHILGFDRAILAEYPYSVTHLHACGLHVIDLISATEEFNALEITLERETGTWDPDAVIAACDTLLTAGKGVIINGELDPDDRDRFIQALDPRRLALFYWLPTLTPLEKGLHDTHQEFT